MRAIKFRCWITDERWKPIHFKEHFPGRMIEVKSIHFGTEKVIVSHKFGNVSLSFDDIELMQFTGMKDCNGVDIYEGDILAREYFMNWVVIYQDSGFRIYNGRNPWPSFPITDLTDRMVVGNIYEHQELVRE